MTIKQKNESPVSEKDESLDKEIMALMQVVNGLNEVSDDDQKFDRVYQYIQIRYGERERRKLDVHKATMNLTIVLSDAVTQALSALKTIRQKLTLYPDMQPNGIIEIADRAIKQVDAVFNEKQFGDLVAYKVYKEIMSKQPDDAAELPSGNKDSEISKAS